MITASDATIGFRWPGRRSRSLAVSLSIAALLAVTACDPGPDIIENERFDVWCSPDTLCSWQNQGAIRRVGTWHPNDYGVSLEGSSVVLSQLGNGVEGCIFFYGLVDIDDDVRLSIELDVFDDGVSEFERRIQGRDFAPVLFDVEMAALAPDTRIIIRKQGSGSAVLAQFFVDRKQGECKGPLVEFELRALGQPCSDDDYCESSACAVTYRAQSGTCGECSDTRPCEDDQPCVQDAETGYSVCEPIQE